MTAQTIAIATTASLLSQRAIPMHVVMMFLQAWRSVVLALDVKAQRSFWDYYRALPATTNEITHINRFLYWRDGDIEDADPRPR